MVAELLAVPDSGASGRRLRGAAETSLRLLLVGAEEVSERWQSATIQTSFWRVYLADGPGVALTWAGGRMAYPVDDLICIPGWLRFRFQWRRRVMHRYIHFEPLGWPRELVESCFSAPFLIRDGGLARALRRLTGRLLDAGAWPPALQHAAHGLACRCLAAAIEGLGAAPRARLFPAGHGRFAAALALVEEALHRPLAVDELAATAGMRPQPFIRAFRRTYRTTPGRFIIERRVARACRLLTEGQTDLPAVARACGFPNRHYLSRMFSRAMGVGPAAYRTGQAARALAIPTAPAMEPTRPLPSRRAMGGRNGRPPDRAASTRPGNPPRGWTVA